MILSVAIVTGFQNEIKGKVIGFASHILISNYDSNRSFESAPISLTENTLQAIKSDVSVKHIQGFTQKAGIIRSGEALEGVLFKGVDNTYDWSFFESHLVKGHIPQINDSVKNNDILISASLASLMKLDVDSSFLIYFIQNPPKTRKLTIKGIYNTGLGENDFDKLYVLGDLKLIQSLNGWKDNQVSGYEIFLHQFSDLNEADERIYQLIPNDMDSQTIVKRYPYIFNWLELVDTNVYIIIVLMLAVAITNMLTALLIMVLERSRMIGVLKALGATNGTVVSIFIKKAGLLIGSGLIIGTFVAIGLALLQMQFGLIKLDPASYYVSEVPINLVPWHIVSVISLSFFICLLSMVVPGMLIVRIKPSRAIRFD
jgi:lipoprotein-releasing system permease protein